MARRERYTPRLIPKRRAQSDPPELCPNCRTTYPRAIWGLSPEDINEAPADIQKRIKMQGHGVGHCQDCRAVILILGQREDQRVHIAYLGPIVPHEVDELPG
jgi:hypothetical protein